MSLTKSEEKNNELGDNVKYIFAIGDIHGSFNTMMAAIDEVQLYVKRNDIKKDEYQVVMLGDYIDRGPNSKEVIEYLMYSDFICLMGNHEDMLLDNYSMYSCELRPDNISLGNFLRNGGIETLESYGFKFDSSKGGTYDNYVTGMQLIPKEHIEWIRDLPDYFETEYHYFVHAGIRPSVDLEDQIHNDKIWIRFDFLIQSDNGYDPGKHIVHGHTPSKTWRPELTNLRTNLDVGAVWSGRQAVGVFDITKPGRPIDILYVDLGEPEYEYDED